MVDGVGVLFSGASDGVRGGGLVVAVGPDGASAGVGVGVVLCVLAGDDRGDGRNGQADGPEKIFEIEKKKKDSI